MNKRVVLGATVSVLLLVVLVAGVYSVDWDNTTPEYGDVPVEQPTFSGNPNSDSYAEDSIWDANGELKENSLAYTIFEKYGLVLIPLAILMFGAMIGGVCISREEVENE